MEYAFFVLVLILIFNVLSKIFSRSSQFTYSKRDGLFSMAERSFLGVLDKAVSSEYRVLGKVRIADILKPQSGLTRKKWQIAFNRISAKHLDYVLCKKDTLEIIAAVELDDKSHNNKRSRKRDEFVNFACRSAGLPLIRFPVKPNYIIDDVKQKIMFELNNLSSITEDKKS